MSRSSRISVLAGALCLIGLMAVLWLRRGGTPADVPKTGQREMAATPQGTGNKERDEGKPRKHERIREPLSAEASARLEGILTDQTVDDATTAERLQEIAAREDLPEAEREEALEHAILLTPEDKGGGLVALARKPSLPAGLASLLLEDFENRTGPTRLEGALALAKNQDEDVRKDAMDLIRFLMDESDSEGNDVEILEKAENSLHSSPKRE